MAKDIDFTNPPRHIAIIMDGNGRWAKKRLLPKIAGHRAGAQNLRKLSEVMNQNGYRMLTVYAFSTENWTRPDDEVAGLMDLLRGYIQQYIDDAKKNNIRLKVIGDTSKLAPDLRDKIKDLIEMTAENDGMILNIALNYGGRDDIVRAARKLSAEVKDGSITPEEITEQLFSDSLDTAGYPDPELLIRTSGELRLSNFMLWQVSYSEIVISDKLWPDFSYNDLQKAVFEYQNRDRRFGGR